ncbi:heavy metal-binding domain-containing protein [Rufibacter ruber]|uniref:heavy metal-binding domain-containing protein n=1 Tax=Rufibacter ruber TaxID=1783499 RepID=UPI000831D8C8|nr:heavy metal-binding domain-containing protein [Rufibacter ruber]
MKAIVLSIGLSILGLTLFSACDSGETKQNTTEQTETKQAVAGVTYTCPMHPEVVSDEPGKCPKCGMFLEEAKAGEQQDTTAGHQHEAGEQH